MAAKLLHSLTDDNPELQKQIGCMTGILQLFDRQPMLTGGRRFVGDNSRRVPLGRPRLNGGSSKREVNSARGVMPTSMEQYSHNRQRISIESSMVSISSSSHSSSLSSPECNRPSQLEQTSFDREIFLEHPSVEPATTLQHPSPQYSRQTIDIRDLVKDSMYREIQGLSIKAKTIEEAVVPVSNVTYRDSPRLQSKISEDGSDLNHSKKTPADLKESLRALAKLPEVPKYHNESGELSRSLSYHSRDAPRFSYDGRETACTPLDSADGPKSSLKLRDLPRLSLDSRERSIQMNADAKSYLLSKSTQKDISVLNGKFQNQQHAPANLARPPSVVAKLMGLEALPLSVSSSNIDTVNITRPMKKAEQMKPTQVTNSAKNLWKEPSSSPRWRNPDSSVKPLSRFPIEPAPWKQIDGSKCSQKPASRIARGSTKAPPTIPSVYSVIEKRLKDLEFTQSGKDLRALKQILEAMQAKGLIETPKEEQDSYQASREDHGRSVDKRQLQTGPTKKKAISVQSHESSIVIMKPMKLVEKSGMPSVVPLDGVVPGLSKFQNCESIDSRKGLSSGRTTKDATSKPGQRVNDSNSANTRGDKSSKTVQSTTRPHQLVKEGNVGSGSKSSGSISPRMQQNKRPPTSPDSRKPMRQTNKQQAEFNSPGGRRRWKPQIYQKNDDQMSDASIESPSLKDPEFRRSDSLEKKSTLISSEGESGKSGCVPPEYSSPISVLENVLRKEDSASPIKYVGKILKVDPSLGNDRNTNSIQHISSESFVSSSDSGAAFEINRKKLQNINSLVQKLRRLNSNHDEARTDYIASLCDNANADHRYVSEILLASGLLLRDLADFQFHPSGHPINPELFLVLEQTKTSSSSKQECSTRNKTLPTGDKVHRKLVFDAVNDFLARKLVPSGPHSEPWILPPKLAKKSLNAQKLLKELCSKIDGLQLTTQKCISDEEADDDGWKNILCKDVHQAESWMDVKRETPGAVLDIERLIFKDLVNEIVNGESKPSGHRHNAK